ncbi:MAG: LacI family transcriptional regulator [Actinomycetota bacterium]|nr:LacI family transcriptional regulator [Actinomycetota bacterium]
MARRVTITDVARVAGVSVATVSKVINNRYGVASETSAHVMRVVEDLGYQSSLVARSMRSQRTDMIGILVGAFGPFSTEILKGVDATLRDTPYDLLAYTGGRHGSASGWERRHLSRLSGTLVDGVILVTPSVVDVDATVPLVVIDPHVGPEDLPSVESDNFIGAVMATRHLLELGHRRIAFLAGRPGSRSSAQRFDGYRHALDQAGIPVDASLVTGDYYDPDTRNVPVFELLSRPDRPTAIFAANDLSAIATTQVAPVLGLRVPDDLSVIGFDDVPEAAQLRTPLSTVRQPLQQMGGAAASLLLELLAGTKPEEEHVVLPTSLVRRTTTGPAPA